MIVDHVEDDADSEFVRAINERPKIVGRSIKAGWSKEIDSIISPAEFSGEIGDRHHFEDCDPQLCQGW